MTAHNETHFGQRFGKLDEPFELLEFLSASVIFMIEILPPPRRILAYGLQPSSCQRVNGNFRPGWRDSQVVDSLTVSGADFSTVGLLVSKALPRRANADYAGLL